MLTFQQFQNSLQKLIAQFTSLEFEDELTDAKKEFFSNTGAVDEAKPNYNLRMNQFYEWYFLTRPLRSYMKTPLLVCEMQRDLRLMPEDQETIEILKNHRHSIFEFLKSKEEEIFLKDLYRKDKICVNNTGLVFGFEEKEYFEARVVTLFKTNYFLKSFCFHPEPVQKFIATEIKKYQKNKDLSLETLLLRLNKMRYKFEQYQHLRPESIYTNENKLGL